MSYTSSKEAARLLGIKTSRLARAVWDERFTPPEKSPSGAYMWKADDLGRASQAILGQPYKPKVLVNTR